MKNFTLHLYFFFLFQLLFVTSLFSSEKFFDPSYSHKYFLTLRRNQGRTVGNKISYTTLDVFSFPFHSKTIWPFFDLRLHRFDKKDKFGGNVGLGCRFTPQFTNAVLGINAYYDYRRTKHANFNQVGLGFEVLGKCWNVRLNGYLPVGNKRTLNSFCYFDDFIGDFFFLQKNYINSLKGLDFELESYLQKICCIDFYLGMGAYYYKGDKCRGDVYGTEYRLTAWYCNYLSFSINATHDSIFKTRVQGQLSFTFPFRCLCQDDRSLFFPVRRREIIVLDKSRRFDSNFGNSSSSCHGSSSSCHCSR